MTEKLSAKLQSPLNKRSRFAVSVFFTFAGASLTAWTVHIPQVEKNLGISHAQIGTIIIMLGLGALIAMQVAGHLVDRFGSKFVVTSMAVLSGLSLALPGLASNVWQISAALLVVGFFAGSLDVSMNAHAVEVEKAYGRPIFSAFHAFWSLGGVIGASFGAAALAAGWSMFTTLSALGVVGVLLGLFLSGWLLANSKSEQASKETQSKEAKKAEKKLQNAANRPFLLVVIALGIMAGAGALIEGVGLDWSSLFLVSVLGASVAQGAVAVIVFSAAMGAFRLLADKVVAKLGRVPVIRYGSLLSAAGLLLALLAQQPAISLIGWGIAGLGISAVVPQIFAYSAGIGEESHSGRNMAKVFGLTYAGMLGGPALIGWLTNVLPLNLALFVGVVLGALIAIASLFLKEDPKA